MYILGYCNFYSFSNFEVIKSSRFKDFWTLINTQVELLDILLCSLARYMTLTVPLSTQVYKWVPVN